MGDDRRHNLLLNSDLARALNQCCELGARLSSALPVFQPQLRDLAMSLAPIADLGSRLNKLSQPCCSNLVKTFEGSAFVAACEQLREFINKIYSPKLDSFISTLDKLPENTRTTLIVLARRGWFIYNSELGLADIAEFNSKIAAGDVQEIESCISDYYNSNITEIEESISEKYKHRAHIIKAAFRAHKSGDYALSIPVFLIQADGICSEMIGGTLFANSKEKNKREPESAKCVQNYVKCEFMAALLAPLTEPLPISASRKQRIKSADTLNRHVILHGESTDYANKNNSLKAISLLYYLCDVLFEIKESKFSNL